MPAKSVSTPTKPTSTKALPASGQAKPIIVVASVVLLVILIIGLAYKNFAPHHPKVAVTTTSIWLEKLARESGGDFSKLSAKDQADLNAKTRGAGAKYLKIKYDSLHAWPWN